MPTLLLMRHAKSDWADDGCPDHDRPLNDRGKRDAPRMGCLLREAGLLPTRIVCSSARRARKTAERLVEGLQAAVPIEIRDELYLASAETWRDVLANLPAEDECVLCIGHNPGLEAIIEQLTGHAERMPTAAIAVLDVGGPDWSTIAGQKPSVRTRDVLTPRKRRDG
jgi:phosphohistidine phosphatase